jgi:hypothetical protein
MTSKFTRLGAIFLMAGMLTLHSRSAFAGQCAQNPRMPATACETILLNAGLDGEGGIHYWFSWGLPDDLQVWQTVPFELAELCFCEEEEDLCDIAASTREPGTPYHQRESNTECFWIDEDENGFLDDCQDAGPHNTHCQ